MIDLCTKSIHKTFMKPTFMYNIYLGIDLCINDRFSYKKYTQNFHETNIYVKNLKVIFNHTLKFSERTPREVTAVIIICW